MSKEPPQLRLCSNGGSLLEEGRYDGMICEKRSEIKH